MAETNPAPWYKRLHWQILIAMALGTLVGLIGGEAVVPKVGWLGTLFIRRGRIFWEKTPEEVNQEVRDALDAHQQMWPMTAKTE